MFTNVIKTILILLSFTTFYSLAAENNDSAIKPENNTANIQAFFQTDDYRNVSLSPDGKHLALIRNHNDLPVIVIVDTKTMKAVNQIYFAKKDRVGRYSWANNERLLIFLSSKQRNKERKAYYGEIYSINIDEEEGEFIFGLRSLFHRGKLRSNVTEADFEKHLAHPKIINLLKDDPRHIIIATSQFESEGMWAYKLDIYKGKLETLARVDGDRLDHDSTRLSYLDSVQGLWRTTVDDENSVTIAQYSFADKSWVKYPLADATPNFAIIGQYKDSKQLMVKDYCGNDTLSICLFEPENKKLTPIYNIAGTDAGWLYFDDKNIPFALSYFDEYPQYKILDDSHLQAKELAELLARFNGYEMHVSRDDKTNGKALISLTSDVQPQVWYLFDRSTKQLSFVAKSKQTIDSSSLLPQYSFKFQARDNIAVQGYITLPKSSGNTAKPAVVLVHGGPHSRDYWGFDPEVQLLSSQGYAVVQVNFRGSEGFGWQFESSGFKQWGENIQYDIIDGVNHLVEKGYIDKHRLCIMGASFGGYSALQSSIIEPSLFKCAIAAAGVYDLELYVDDSEEREATALMHRVGTQKIQAAHSPVNAIDKLQTPLLLVHGTKDDRTPLEQAEVLIEQLDKHNKIYQWLEYKNEGHGLFNSANRYNFYEQVLVFLNKHNPVSNKQ